MMSTENWQVKQKKAVGVNDYYHDPLACVWFVEVAV